MLAELDALDDNAVVRRNTWGLDLAGLGGAPTSITGAAGIGGLLAVQDESADEGGGPVQRDLVYFYDGNGNVGQVLRSTPAGPFAARYEYDAYGNVVSSQDWYAGQNPWRFSTRYADDDTDLLYYGHRYYHAGRGEWLSHEPLGEAESLRLRTFVRNAPTRFVDVAGMYTWAEGDGGMAGLADRLV